MRTKQFYSALALSLISFCISSCQKDCTAIQVSFKNRWADHSLRVIVDGVTKMTLSPGESGITNLSPGSHEIEWEGIGGADCGSSTKLIDCDDDGSIEIFCPG